LVMLNKKSKILMSEKIKKAKKKVKQKSIFRFLLTYF
jgi:hypothetical protein